MIVCENVSKKYLTCTAVNNVSLTLEPGKVYAMLGPNGSGKTTLMKMIVGIVRPTQGTIYVDNVPFKTEDKGEITYMPTENYFYTYMNVKDVVKFYKDFYRDFDENVFNSMMARMELSFSDKVKNMSTGMLAKLKLAIAMARDSKVILLDEPLNGIDIIAREVILDTIKANKDGKRSFVISSHLVDELEDVTDGVFFLKHGNMVLQGDLAEVTNNHEKTIVDLYKEIYGSEGYMNA